jgi:hypothetical protein
MAALPERRLRARIADGAEAEAGKQAVDGERLAVTFKLNENATSTIACLKKAIA